MDYEEMLKRAYSKLKKVEGVSSERFEVPQVRGHIEGNKTIISNFLEIASLLRRDKDHILKFLQRELATPGKIEGERLILGKKISSSSINQKIGEYCQEFVLCKECKKPDTQLLKEERIFIKKCAACGAKQPVRSKI